MAKYICIHGHFYQPPRENPWLEAVENQGSASPYHDWNERITEECYLPNSAARILNEKGQIGAITNNYQKISFNYGPTLLSWIKDKYPELLSSLQEADRQSKEMFGGHGNALAQAYNHMILPLANSRDKYTQIYWGIKDFELYFNRKPEGLWLAETAVDLETLDIMSELGIQFTILAPNQLKEIKGLEEANWQQEFSSGTPYLQKLPSGRTITLFFYDGGISKAVAFEKLLNDGQRFASRLMDSFPAKYTENNLMHIATDGETYGHHHAHGDMGLAYALDFIEQQPKVQLTNYAEFMEIQPAQYEVNIHENSSWSCAHGVERWRSDCGCNNGQGWHQQWRAPLRHALDWLRDELNIVFEQRAGSLLKDPWHARNEYIKVIHDRSQSESFLNEHAAKELSDSEKTQVLQWMELQRHAMLMYTSCGWFFDEISGIETVQIIKYAARAIQLAKQLTGNDYEPKFLELLALAPSNFSEYENGAKIYEMFVKPQCIDLYNVSAHLAASLPFNTYEEVEDIYCYRVELRDTKEAIAGKEQLISGNFIVHSKITAENLTIAYAVFYSGDQNLICAIKKPDPELDMVFSALHEAFDRGDTFEVVKLFETHFGDQTLSLRDLFYDMKLRITQEILASSVSDLEKSEQQFFDNNSTLIHFITDLNIELPQTIKSALSSLINKEIIDLLSAEVIDIAALNSLFEKTKRYKVQLDDTGIAYVTDKLMETKAKLLPENINDSQYLEYLLELVQFIKEIPIDINLWHLQNKVFELVHQKNNDNSLLQKLAQELNLELQ